MTSSEAMRPEFIIMNPRANIGLRSGNAQILMCPTNSGYGLRLESSLQLFLQITKALPVNVFCEYSVGRAHITSTWYFDVLQIEVPLAICTKPRQRQSQGVLLLHDSSCPHTADNIMTTLRTLILQFHEYPSSIRHLSPSNFRLFRPLKKALRSWKIADDAVVKEAVRDRICA